MQAIASYSALATLKAAYVKDLFTNLSKDYFLSITAEDAAKAANTLLPPKEVCAKILIELYKPIVQAVTSYARRYHRAIRQAEHTELIHVLSHQTKLIIISLEALC
ncbi:hypothetical protein HBH99_046870 [Parastagonospora nodorum]|nr:hypothetical protein HBH99_046870 [Parastagonospora nodorum]